MAVVRGYADRRSVTLPGCYITIESRPAPRRRMGGLLLVSVLAATAAGFLTAERSRSAPASCRPLTSALAAPLSRAPGELAGLVSGLGLADLGAPKDRAPGSPAANSADDNHRGLKIVLADEWTDRPHGPRPTPASGRIDDPSSNEHATSTP